VRPSRRLSEEGESQSREILSAFAATGMP
jgi:hypothetical protein